MNAQPTHNARYSLVLQLLALCLLLPTAGAQTLPGRFLPEEIPTLNAEVEPIAGRFPGALVVPHNAPTVIDDRYTRPYHTLCSVYVGQPAREPGTVVDYARRFAVHAPDADTLPLARRVARLLLLLYGEAHSRLRFDHPTRQTVDVWLMPAPGSGQAADAGGEQFRNQIYLYDLFAARRPIEWGREIAHEYGHYALPAVAGYTAPEEWANGYLGERLFWKWLGEDLHRGRLQPDEIPFVTPADVDDYTARQIAPLIARFAQAGVGFDPAPLLAKRDTTGMDNFIGLALTIDALYGSAALLSAFTYTEPKPGSPVMDGTDFLRGVLASLRVAQELRLTPPNSAADPPPGPFLFYLPAGDWTIQKEDSTHTWRLTGDARVTASGHLMARTAGWRRLTLLPTGSEHASLHLSRAQ